MAILTRREWMSGPAWNCFRTDFRRRWRGRNIAHAFGILFLISGLQLAVSLAVRRLWVTPGGLGLYSLMAAFQLCSSLIPPLAGGFRSASPKIESYLLLQGIVTLPWLACHFLMPAAAASSITPDREQRRVPDLILAGLTPRQILVAKGMAAVLPFLALAAAALIAQYVAYHMARIADPGRFNAGFSPGLMLLSGSGVAAASLFLSAAIEVCFSALSRRVVSATVICYSFQCVLVPLLSLVSLFAWALVGMGWLGISADLAPQLTVLLLEAITFCVLWPRALRAIAYQD